MKTHGTHKSLFIIIAIIAAAASMHAVAAHAFMTLPT